MRVCVMCGKELAGRQTKLCSEECRRIWKNEYQRIWRLNNLGKEKERQRKWRQNNPEKEGERQQEYYQNNRVEILEQKHKDRQNNPEKIKRRNREWRQNNPEKVKESRHKYCQNNPEKVKERNREYYQSCREKENERSHEYYQNNTETIKGNRCKRYRRVRDLPEDCNLFKESSIEFIMKRWLQESDIEFVEQHYINLHNTTYTRVDFYIPEANVCLYVDGDYWHGPERPDTQERDTEQNRTLASMGYSVVRMTETEILEGNRPWWIGELISTKW